MVEYVIGLLVEIGDAAYDREERCSNDLLIVDWEKQRMTEIRPLEWRRTVFSKGEMLQTSRISDPKERNSNEPEGLKRGDFRGRTLGKASLNGHCGGCSERMKSERTFEPF